MEASTPPKPNLRDKSKNLTQQIGARIAMYREQVGLSQTAVAKKAGLSPSHLCNMEKGDRSIDVEKLGAIARALNCKMVDFLPIAEGGRPLSPERHSS
jgi:transcriptional regulator with XRE-family HTH domain